MHILFGKILKYFLWFLFTVVVGAFLVWFAKFGFNPTLYIEYLNNIDMKQLFISESIENTGTVLSGTISSGDISDTTGVYDPSMEDWIFTTGTSLHSSGAILSWSTTNEAYGFVKNSDTWSTITPSKSPSVSTWTAKVVSGDTKTQLLNLIKSKEK